MYFKFLLSAISSFILSLILTKRLIPVLKRLKFGQEVRQDGPKTHLIKQGTPTMGGIGILFAILVPSLIGGIFFPCILRPLFLTAALGTVGFLDDYLKIKKHSSDGLKPKEKLLLQVLSSLIYICLICFGGISREVALPFTKISFNLGMIFPLFAFFVIAATDNGANFTDGLDGLCSLVTGVISLFLAFIGIKRGDPTAILSGAVFGSLMGFLIFNSFPAKLFMGDTGSLMLGGFVSSVSLELGIALYIPIFAFIYFIEVLSVILQVGYFKKTKGKRLFLMAPIHHHFEKLGFSETRVNSLFMVITVFLCLIAYGSIG